ncbi:hypothetical protein BGW80DRAFT_1276380 [Lactifluus volemus]|nr:hypothetical protein BGW80DRAFT_1276380 [Lactifluus volemus]
MKTRVALIRATSRQILGCCLLGGVRLREMIAVKGRAVVRPIFVRYVPVFGVTWRWWTSVDLSALYHTHVI